MNELQSYVNFCGGLQAFAKKVGVSYQAIQKWFDKGEVPLARVKQVNRLTKINKSKLNRNT